MGSVLNGNSSRICAAIMLLIVITLVIYYSSSNTSIKVYTNNDVSLLQQHETNFVSSNWKLYTGYIVGTGRGLPMEPYLKMFATDGKSILMIRKPSDLEKMPGASISINTEKDALSLVHLFTSPETYYMYEYPQALEDDHTSAIVMRKGNTFLISRKLYFRRHNSSELAKVEEQVSYGGHYSIISRRHVDYSSFPSWSFH